jgi:hypothetical protein
VWYNVNVNEGSPRQARVTVQVSKVVTIGSTPTPLKVLQKKIKKYLTSPTKCGIIKMSKGKSKAKTSSVRLEKILGRAEKRS